MNLDRKADYFCDLFLVVTGSTLIGFDLGWKVGVGIFSIIIAIWHNFDITISNLVDCFKGRS